ncbi:MAG: DUF4234 domain-containing protein [Candidatus Omnitrophica bacterium]|nr:DUF4234 domain-containing protein [Candidatus Omnitrophota bacterium]
MDQSNVSSGQVGGQKESQHNISIPVYLILTLLSCGFFNIYWNYRQMEACNDLLGKKEFDFWLWFLLTIVTCGIYHIFYQYKMGSAIVEIQHNKNKVVFDNLPIISVLVTIFGMTVIVDCIHQSEINKIVS